MKRRLPQVYGYRPGTLKHRAEANAEHVQGTVPDAHAIGARYSIKSTTEYEIEVICPYCKDIHIHPWEGPGHAPGHRSALCGHPRMDKVNRAGYNIIISDTRPWHNHQATTARDTHEKEQDHDQ